MARIEFFFDVASPYTWLAVDRIVEVAESTGAELVWRPMLLGGLFKTVGNTMPAALAPRGAWMLADLGRIATQTGTPLRFPANFPPNSLGAMRACAGVPDAALPAFARAIFHAYWFDNLDPSDPSTLRAAATEAGLDPDAVLASVADPDVKAKLRATTDEAAKRGAFGAPTFFVQRDDGDEAMFWGQDRVDQLAWYLGAS